MTDSLRHRADGSAAAWHIRGDDPFVSGARLPDGLDPSTVSRYGADRWILNCLELRAHDAGRSVRWDLFPGVLRESFRRAGWALTNLPTPEELLERSATARVKWPAAGTMEGVIDKWLQFARWLVQRGIADLREVDEDVLVAYARHTTGRGRSKTATVGALYAVSVLWGFAPHLLAQDRIPMPPWEAHAMKDYLPTGGGGNENGTCPIHPAVMAPLLIWAMRFVEDFSDDIIAAWAEYQRLTASIRHTANPGGSAKLKAFLEHHAAEGIPLPGAAPKGTLGVAEMYLAAVHHTNLKQVQNVLSRYRGQLRRTGKPALTISTETPLDVPIRGQLHGRAWTTHINFHDAPTLMRRLSAACLVVVSYLSGVRAGEALELQVGCCPEPADDGTGTVHYELRGHFLKGAYDEDGKLVPEGLPRHDPWTVVLPVARAVKVLERIATSRFLFPSDEPWTPRNRRNTIRAGEAMSTAGASYRISEFINWVNTFATERGLSGERIPDDPDGAITIGRFRRTIAWHIARLPGGRIALAIQYGHLRTATGQKYSGRARQGLGRVLDIETARSMADYLSDLADRIDHGEGVSGPAARRMLKAAADAQTRYEGMFLTPRQAEAVLREPEFHVYDNPEAFLTCNHDPAKALCHPDRALGGNRDRPPAIDRCDPACSNIARTDEHITGLRREITRLTEEAASPLTPIPLRRRHNQRIPILQAIVDRHERTRTVTRGGSTDDR